MKWTGFRKRDMPSRETTQFDTRNAREESTNSRSKIRIFFLVFALIKRAKLRPSCVGSTVYGPVPDSPQPCARQPVGAGRSFA